MEEEVAEVVRDDYDVEDGRGGVDERLERWASGVVARRRHDEFHGDSGTACTGCEGACCVFGALSQSLHDMGMIPHCRRIPKNISSSGIRRGQRGVAVGRREAFPSAFRLDRAFQGACRQALVHP